MAGRGFLEAAPLPVTERLGALLGAELARVGVQGLPDVVAARRLLSTVRAFLLAGEAVAVPGLGRFVMAEGVAPGEPGEPGVAWARLVADPELTGKWPGSVGGTVDAFARRWMSFVTPRRAGDGALVVPDGMPVRVVAQAESGRPAAVLVPVPEDPTDAFALPWLNEMAARVSAAVGTLWVAGVEGAARTIYLGAFEHGRHVSLFSEEVGALFADLLPPDPHVPAAPRELWPLLAAASREVLGPSALARRLALGETAGGVDLDAVAGVLAGPDVLTGRGGLGAALRFAWACDQPAEVLMSALGRACGRLARELAALTTREACADLGPLGVLMRLDEPELRVMLGGLGRVTLPARSRWVLALMPS